MSLTVVLQNNANDRHVPSQKQFQTWINQIIISLPHAKRWQQQRQIIGICILDKKKMQKLNKTYRNKNKPTNILAFSYRLLPDKTQSCLGDLAICSDIIRQEAISQDKTIRAHWAHLTIHGVLHLLGYDHDRQAKAKKMESLEIEILKKLGFENPY